MTKIKKISNNRQKEIKPIFGDEAEKEVARMNDPVLTFNVFIEEDEEVALYVEGDLVGADVEILSKALKNIFKAYGIKCSQEYCRSILKITEEN